MIRNFSICLVLLSFFITVGVCFADSSRSAILAKKAVKTNDSSFGLMYWGASEKGWRLGIEDVPEKLSYVASSGYGEDFEMPMTLTSDQFEQKGSRDFKEVDFSIVFSSVEKAGRSIVLKQRLKGSRARSSLKGSSWRFWASVSLHELAKSWGEMPQRFEVSVRLSHEGLPSVDSSSPSIDLALVALDKATFAQKIKSLSTGMDQKKVLKVLGKASHSQGERSIFYWNDVNAPKGFPAGMQSIQINFDSKGTLERIVNNVFYGC